MAARKVTREDVRDFMKEGLEDVAKWVASKAGSGDNHKQILKTLMVLNWTTELIVEVDSVSSVRIQDDQPGNRQGSTSSLSESLDQGGHLKAG